MFQYKELDFKDKVISLSPLGRVLFVIEERVIIGVNDSQRVVADLAPLVFDGLGFIDVVPDAYIVTYNEIVHLPNNIVALARPRSSLLRCGVTVDTAVWDAGYSGRSQSLMIVYNRQGFRLQRNARIVQLIFLKLTRETEGYRGAYQGENI